jgi:hypothetical protein
MTVAMEAKGSLLSGRVVFSGAAATRQNELLFLRQFLTMSK